MKRIIALSGLLAIAASPLLAGTGSLKGSYVEARTAEVFTGGCIMGSEAETTGKQAVLAWKVSKGSFNGVSLDGLTIVVDPDVGLEMRCFILLHLFGHSVQWVAPSLEGSLDELQHTTDQPRFMQVLREYEFEAARFGLQLLHEAGVTDLDAWYSDFVETDWRYVERYYATGQIPNWADCVVRDAPAIAPAPIQPLTLRQVEVRFAF